jgi:flagellar basal body-associated protein FliL
VSKIIRIVGILLVLVVVVVAAAPFWFGMQAEKNYNNLIQQMSKGGSGTFTTTSYERG